jgi:hypothetical protein
MNQNPHRLVMGELVTAKCDENVLQSNIKIYMLVFKGLKVNLAASPQHPGSPDRGFAPESEV